MLDEYGQPIICQWSGKIAYSYQQAVTTLHVMRRNPHVHGHRPTRVYQCEDCGAWHLTHCKQDKRRRRRH